jgi:tetratricopeptide (TPR) repeat protein
MIFYRCRALMLALALALLAVVSAGPAAADQNSPGLEKLFQHLKNAGSKLEADIVESAIWALWIQHGDKDIDSAMTLGIAAMHAGDHQNALGFLTHVVKAAPHFAEGWNKRATAYYLVGDYDASVADIRSTLALEPRHFGALSGLGLIYDAIGRPETAVKVWQKALEIHPFMQGIRHRMQELSRQGRGDPT